MRPRKSLTDHESASNIYIFQTSNILLIFSILHSRPIPTPQFFTDITRIWRGKMPILSYRFFPTGKVWWAALWVHLDGALLAHLFGVNVWNAVVLHTTWMKLFRCPVSVGWICWEVGWSERCYKNIMLQSLNSWFWRISDFFVGWLFKVGWDFAFEQWDHVAPNTLAKLVRFGLVVYNCKDLSPIARRNFIALMKLEIWSSPTFKLNWGWILYWTEVSVCKKL